MRAYGRGKPPVALWVGRVVAVIVLQRVGYTVALVGEVISRHSETESGNPRRLDGNNQIPAESSMSKNALNMGFSWHQEENGKDLVDRMVMGK